MFSSIPEIIRSYQRGEMVIFLDDENRENEGDLLAPASLITPEQINFMATHARGLICLTLTSGHCEKLNLPPMVGQSSNANATNFTLTIEASKNITTGISAKDRARTVQAAVSPEVRPGDIVTPGHIFPLKARDGGVLVRAGHTEAGCDIAKLAGMPTAASVIVEIMNEDGTMARLLDLQKFSKKHNIKLGSIADLIRYRLEHESLIEQTNIKPLGGIFADFNCHFFYDKIDKVNHYALVKGDVSAHDEVWVRVHIQNYFDDISNLMNINIEKQDLSHWKLQEALEFIKKQSAGVVVVLDINTFTNAQNSTEYQYDDRSFGKGAQILNLLGLQKIKIMGSELSYKGINGFGLQMSGFLTKQQYLKN